MRDLDDSRGDCRGELGGGVGRKTVVDVGPNREDHKNDGQKPKKQAEVEKEAAGGDHTLHYIEKEANGGPVT